MDNGTGMQGVNPQTANPVQGMLPPVQSSVPELEQVLVKIQELEQRIGDCELSLAKDATGEVNETPLDKVNGAGPTYEKLKSKMEKLSKTFKEISKTFKEAEELTGVPEIIKDDKKESPEKAANAEVPNAITSEIGTPEKTGAPVAGEETGLDGGKKQDREKETEAGEDAIGKVPKAATDYPKDAVQKNSLEQEKDDSTPKDPEEMESEEGKKVPVNSYEELYKGIQERLIKENKKRMAERKESLSGRRTVVGASAIKESYKGSESSDIIKEYLQKAGVRL